MDAPLSIPIQLSGEAKWHARILKSNRDIKNISARNIPFSFLEKMNACIAPKWDLISDMAIRLSQQCTSKKIESPRKWLLCITEDISTIKIKNILDVCRKAGLHQKMEIILLDDFSPQKIEKLNALERQRKKANNPKSKNFMNHLDDYTLNELAKKIQEYDHWQQLADALGLSNFAIYNSPTAYYMLQNWKTQNENATVPRLKFEAEQLNMRAVCNFLDAIPLEGTSKISLVDLSPSNQLECIVTKFHIHQINFVARAIKTSGASRLCWNSYITKHHQSEFRYHSSISSQYPYDPLWQKGELKLNTLLENFKKSPETTFLEGKIRQAIKKGNFEVKSSGGVSLHQIQYLIEASWHTDSSNALKSPFETLFQDMAERKLSNDPYRQIAETLFEKKDTRYLNGYMDFPKFLILFWQLNDSSDFDLYAFKTKLMEVMNSNSKIINDPALINELKNRLTDLLPMRTYDPELAVENLSKLKKKCAEKVEVVVKPALENLADDQLCIICIERERKYALVPCGHYAFCLECITEINQCSVCSSTIQGKLEIFKP